MSIQHQNQQFPVLPSLFRLMAACVGVAICTTTANTQDRHAKSVSEEPIRYAQTINSIQPIPPMSELDPVRTGGVGDTRIRSIWEKMRAEQEACNHCARRQPFPGDQQLSQTE